MKMGAHRPLFKHLPRAGASLWALLCCVLLLAGCGADAPAPSDGAALPVTADGPVLPEGVWAEGSYRNDFAGFTFTPASGWEAAGSSEIAQWRQTLGDGDASVVYDMLAFSLEDGSSVLVTLQPADDRSAEDYLGQGIDALTEQDDWLFGEPGSTRLGGVPYVTVSVDAADGSLCQRHLARVQDDVLVAVTVSAPSKARVRQALACFQKETP